LLIECSSNLELLAVTTQVHDQMMACVCIYLYPCTVEWEVMCIYKALQNEATIPSTDGPTTNPSLTTPLTLNQFYGLYGVINLRWRRVNKNYILC